ncbi:MAG: glutaredoxin [Cyclobacteriaceae bacterium]|nr:glutaredoxin [Cyclobacteriaceae bacterium]MDH4298629.1 glutaredoxin [Cyclobacteriaceae bacterium]MDH5249433.1 glutaredoxin [Cyclobacteriaceae bacterium]
MQFHPNELFLVYDPQSNVGKQTRAIAHDICNHINEVDVTHEKLSPTYWKEILNMARVHPDELLDHAHPDYKLMVSTNMYTMDGWLELMVHDSHLVMYPIVIFNGNAVVCHTPTDIMKIKPKLSTKVLPHLKDSH